MVTEIGYVYVRMRVCTINTFTTPYRNCYKKKSLRRIVRANTIDVFFFFAGEAPLTNPPLLSRLLFTSLRLKTRVARARRFDTTPPRRVLLQSRQI